MTKQEEMFFERVALKMNTDATLTIEAAARMVCNDDVRILNTYSRLSDEKQGTFKRLFCDHVYRVINAT